VKREPAQLTEGGLIVDALHHAGLALAKGVLRRGVGEAARRQQPNVERAVVRQAADLIERAGVRVHQRAHQRVRRNAGRAREVEDVTGPGGGHHGGGSEGERDTHDVIFSLISPSVVGEQTTPPPAEALLRRSSVHVGL
jgi:hypothetical protein